MDIGISPPDLAIRDFEKVPETDAETDILDYLVGVLSVNVVLKSVGAWFGEVSRRDLNHVGNCSLAR